MKKDLTAFYAIVFISALAASTIIIIQLDTILTAIEASN